MGFVMGHYKHAATDTMSLPRVSPVGPRSTIVVLWTLSFPTSVDVRSFLVGSVGLPLVSITLVSLGVGVAFLSCAVATGLFRRLALRWWCIVLRLRVLKIFLVGGMLGKTVG